MLTKAESKLVGLQVAERLESGNWVIGVVDITAKAVVNAISSDPVAL